MTDCQKAQLACEVQKLADRFVSLGADYTDVAGVLVELASKLDSPETTLDEIERPCKETRFVL